LMTHPSNHYIIKISLIVAVHDSATIRDILMM
jgi:hypothetical protein